MFKTILIADDEKDTAMGYEALLSEEENLNIVTVPNGERLVALSKNMDVDLIILDLLMPIMSGMEALKLIRQQCNNVDVIVVSALPRDTVEPVIAEKLGIRRYFQKPFNPKELIKEIENCLKPK